MDTKQQIIEELSKAGIDPELEAKMKRLERRRITPQTAIEQKQFLFRMFGKPCFPRGELVAITGKKKCGKTFFSSLLMTLCTRRECMSMSRISDEPLTSLWIDTEQSEESTQEIIVNRIMPMIGDAVASGDGWGGIAFNLRAENWNDRMALIEMAARQHKPDLIIFDGIRDVVNDINDGVMAQEVLERTMRLASELQCCICCVLHQNKSLEDKTLRGALGTELGNKCFEEYECKKDADHRLFECHQVSTRKYDIMDKLVFTVEDNGLPRLLSGSELESLTDSGDQSVKKPQRVYNPEYVSASGTINFLKAFDVLLPEGVEKRAGQLEQEFLDLVGLNNDKRYGFLRKQALDEGAIMKREEGPQRVFYSRGPNAGKVLPL